MILQVSIRVSALIAASLTSLVLVACGTVAPASPTEQETGNPSLSAPERNPRPAATPTPDRRPRIDQLVLTTDLDENGVPVDDRSAIPTSAAVAYLAVRVRDVEPGTQFAAEWVRDGETIGLSEQRSRGEALGEQWISLRFAPQGGFRFGRYAVRLSVEGQFIESLVFNAGGGSRTRPVSTSRLVFAPEWTGDHESVRPRATFGPETDQVVAILSNSGETPAEDLTSYWRLGDDEVAEVPADDVSTSDFQVFTYQPGAGLASGHYDVVVRSGNQELAVGAFFIQERAETLAGMVVQEFVVTPDIDPESSLPVGDSIEEVETPVELFGMVLVENLEESDVLEVVWYRNNEEEARSRLSEQSLTRNWVRYRYSLPAEEGDADADYRAVVLLNDIEVASHPFVALPPQ